MREASGVHEPVWRTADETPFAGVPLPARSRCDLLVVGGGILGLSAALAAAERGAAVRVVEADRVGDGASGVNGGQVIPGLKYDPDTLRAKFGAASGERLVRFAAGTADAAFARAQALGVPHRRAGWIQAATTDTALAAAAERCRQWGAEGADVALLDAATVAALTGARGYRGGFLDRRAGTIDPRGYTLALARAAVAAGAAVSEGARATALRREGAAWRVAVGVAEVAADRVLVATNAATDGLVPGLARTLVPLHSLQIATARLPDALAATILPGGQAVSDSRRILVYHRRTPDGRVMLGGRGPMRAPRDPADWRHLERALVRLYPALAGVPIERRWYGRVAMTADHLPHIHEPAPGLWAAVGCQGRGVGLMTALGPCLAAAIVAGDRDALPFPPTPIRPIPLHALRTVGVAALIAWYRARDALER